MTTLPLILAILLTAAIVTRRHLAAARAPAPARVLDPVAAAQARDPLLVRRIPADIAGAYPLEVPDKDTARHLLTSAATPAAHRYAAAMAIRSTQACR